MVESLVKHVNGLAQDALANVYLEDMALCAAWLDSHADNPEIIAAHQPLREHFDIWPRVAQLPNAETEGVRQQPILRRLISDVLRGGAGELQRDELEFLYFVWAFATRSVSKNLFERPLSCLESHMAAIEERRNSLEPAAGLPNISRRFGICSAEELRAAAPYDAKSFGGLDIAMRGPIFFHKGDIKVIDNVPAECAVVSEGGECSVNGPVFGKVAATGNCEVFGNISGVVVSRRGIIRAAKILNHAVVVSKEGGVRCTEAQSPELVFGMSEVRIRGQATGGQYLGDVIEMGGTLTGGVAQVSQLLKAPEFCGGEHQDLWIVLRRSLTCQDYGEKMGITATRLLSSAVRYRQQVVNLNNLKRLNDRESEEYAMSILLFLLGAEDSQDLMQKLHRLRVRMAYLSHMETVTRSLIARFEADLGEGGGEGDEEGKKSSSAELRAIVEEMERDLNGIAAEAPIEKDAYEIRDEVVMATRKAHARGAGTAVLPRQLVELTGILDRLNEKLRQTGTAAQTVEKALEQAAGRSAALQKVREGGSCNEMLARLLEAGRSGEASEAFRRRASERYVKLLLRHIEQRKSRSTAYQSAISTAEKNIQGVSEKLWRDHQISLPHAILHGGPEQFARVEGAFGHGVHLCVWKHQVQASRAGDRGYWPVEPTDGAVAAFSRDEGGNILKAEPSLVKA